MMKIKATVIILSIAGAVVVGRQSITEAKDASGKVTAQPKVRSAGKAKSSSTAQAVPAGVTVNACGCYRTESGACFCGDKNGACLCPGDCEPMACEQKRAKEIQRAVAAETKKAQDDEKRRLDQAAAAEVAAAARSAEPKVVSSGDSVDDEADDSVPEEKKADEAKPEKHPAKPSKHTVAKP